MLTLTEKTVSEIQSEGEQSFPGECCGILLGLDEAITALLPIPNAREQQEQYHRFRIEPDDLMKAEKTARERGLDVLGFYHSHPNAPSKPSDYDREHAIPYYIYLIISVREGKPETLTAWNLTLDRTQFNETEYTILK